MIYNQGNTLDIPSVDLLTFLFEDPNGRATETTPLHAEARAPQQCITKARVRELTDNFAHFFRTEYGIGANGPSKDVVVCVSTGQSVLSCLFYGVIAAEGIFSPASPATTANDVARQIRDGPGKVIVCSSDAKELAVAAAAIAGLPERNVLVITSYPVITLQSVNGEATCRFQQRLRWRKITNRKELETSTICIYYSSGTTGLPKGVALSHTSLVCEAVILAFSGRTLMDKARATVRTIAHLPIAHIAALICYCVTPFYDGGIVYWMPGFNFEDFVRHCGELKVTYIFSVPPVFVRIAKDPGITDEFSHLVWATSGAAPLSAELQRAAKKQMKLEGLFAQVWGMTETCAGACWSSQTKPNTEGSIGYLLPNVLMRLVDDNGKDVPEGQPGEALVKSPLVMQGYHRNPEATKATFTEDGWLRTGDIFQRRGEEFFVVDRKKELIKYKGIQVAPAELEGIIASHPDVLDAAVIGIAQNHTEVPRAYVVLAPSAKGKVNEVDIIDFVKNKAADYKRLRGGVWFIDIVPRGASGKILRNQVRMMRKNEEQRAKL